MTAVGRNSPCPCGSGKRFKECHGAAGSVETIVAVGAGLDQEPRLHAAWQRLQARDFDAAEALARQVLATMPEHPAAHRIVGQCASERGDGGAAMRALLRAARALRSFPVSGGEQLGVWTDLNFMFVRVLPGIDSALALAKRQQYAGWLQSLPRTQPGAAPQVSVVLVVPQPEPWLEKAIQSVCRQTYKNLELIVASAADDPGGSPRLKAALRECPFPHRVLSQVGATEAALVNAGVRLAGGTFVNLLHARHELAADRIALLVEQVAQRGVRWGFTGVEFIDGDGRLVGRDGDFLTRRWIEAIASIEHADSLGFAFLDHDCVAVGPSNLFFAKALFDELGGVRELPVTYAWDFCLRAVWLAEPLRIATQLYRHRLGSEDSVTSPASKAAFEAAQLTMFRDFYDKASGEEAAPNPFAPSLHHWRLHFLKVPFRAGHILMFDIDRLELLGDMILRRREQSAGELESGLDLLGFAFGEFGLGESLRGLANACVVGGIPFSVRDLEIRTFARQADRSMEPFLAEEPKHRCSLYCMNPDMVSPFRQLMSEAERAGIYGIGYWYWELEHLPGEWTDALGRFDEIWVASEFVAEAVRRSSTMPVIKIPPPIEVKLAHAYRRSDFSLPENPFLFLFSFDFNSASHRKNPEGAVAAFRKAFDDSRRDVGLVLKCVHATRQLDKLHALEDAIGGDDRIILLNQSLSRDQVSGLESVVDAYVSLHRSEGLGLGLAESMYLGKPVIGTAYSGNLEFMNEDNSCLVDFQLVPVRKGEYLYDDARFRWADPDTEQAAHHMRRLVDDEAFRKRIAHQGQIAIRTRFTPSVTAELIRHRLGELGLL